MPKQEKPVVLMTGTMIPVSSDTKGKYNREALDAIFSHSMDKMTQGIEASKSENPEDHKRRAKKASKKNGIKESWEEVKSSKKLSMGNPNDLRAITPSRGAVETNNGGAGHLRATMASIFDPDALSKIKEDEFTQHVVDAGKKKRREKEARLQKSRDWEDVAPSKTTANTDPTQMGFTPHRTAFKPAPLPEVKVREIEAQKAAKAKSIEAGKEAAVIKSELDRIMMASMEKRYAGDKKWEEIEADKIAEIHSKEVKTSESGFKFAESGIINPDPEKRADQKVLASLDGIFSMPPDPKDAPRQDYEADIKKNLRIASNRERRESDRSWETVRNAKSKKMNKKI